MPKKLNIPAPTLPPGMNLTNGLIPPSPQTQPTNQISNAQLHTQNKFEEGPKFTNSFTNEASFKGANLKGGSTSSLWDLKFSEAKGDLSDPTPFDAYLDSPYNYNDAEALASFWGTSVSEAKDSIGMKLMNGDDKSLAFIMSDANKYVTSKGIMGTKGEFNVKGYNALKGAYNGDYDEDYDANIEAKGGYGFKGGYDAKFNDAEIYKNGLDLKGDSPSGMDDWTGLQAFFKAGHPYNDAVALANHWEMSIEDAKSYIGEKLMSGQDKLLSHVLSEANIKLGE